MGQYGGVDDFDDNSVDPLRWVVLPPLGSGALTENNQRLEFNSSGSGTELQYYAWADANYDEDFELVFRAANTTMPDSLNEFAGIGIEIYPAGSATTRLNVRLGSYSVTNFGPSRDLLANFFVGTASIPTFPVQPATVFPKAVAVRVVYDSALKVFTVFYDENTTDGVQWTQLSTFGVSSAGNGANNADFGLGSGGQFDVFVYGRSDNLDVDSGELLMDDFQLVEGGASEPDTVLSESAAVEFTTQIGKSYAVHKSTDLTADPAFASVQLAGSEGTYRIVPAGQGKALVTGTGNTIFILDSTRPSNEAAFYKIVTQ